MSRSSCIAMPTSSITSWDKFAMVFLEKYYPTHKMAKIQNAINLSIK